MIFLFKSIITSLKLLQNSRNKRNPFRRYNIDSDTRTEYFNQRLTVLNRGRNNSYRAQINTHNGYRRRYNQSTWQTNQNKSTDARCFKCGEWNHMARAGKLLEASTDYIYVGAETFNVNNIHNDDKKTSL